MDSKKISKENIANVINIETYENKRKKEFLKYKLFCTMAAFSAVFVIYYAFCAFSAALKRENDILPGCLIFVSILFLMLFCYFMLNAKKIKTSYIERLKRHCYKEIRSIVSNLEWFGRNQYDKYRASILTDKIITSSGLFIKHCIRTIDDEFRGLYKGVSFRISETKLMKASEDNPYDATNIFKGIIMLFDINKKVLNRTIISSKNDFIEKHSFFFRIISEKILPMLFSVIIFIFFVTLCVLFMPNFEIMNDHKTLITAAVFIGIFGMLWLAVPFIASVKKTRAELLDKVTLEDSKFNKKFNVYSSDQVEARYLVTPSFMERLNNLTTAFGTNKVKCSFFDDKFMIAISTNEDLFEIGRIDKPLTNSEALESFYRELNSIYDMIDYFKLDEKTGL